MQRNRKSSSKRNNDALREIRNALLESYHFSMKRFLFEVTLDTNAGGFSGENTEVDQSELLQKLSDSEESMIEQVQERFEETRRMFEYGEFNSSDLSTKEHALEIIEDFFSVLLQLWTKSKEYSPSAKKEIEKIVLAVNDFENTESFNRIINDMVKEQKGGYFPVIVGKLGRIIEMLGDVSEFEARQSSRTEPDSSAFSRSGGTREIPKSVSDLLRRIDTEVMKNDQVSQPLKDFARREVLAINNTSEEFEHKARRISAMINWIRGGSTSYRALTKAPTEPRPTSASVAGVFSPGRLGPTSVRKNPLKEQLNLKGFSLKEATEKEYV
jgi:hypothetical protein